MKRRIDMFTYIDPESRRECVARALGCNPASPADWPHEIIDVLVAIRLQAGIKAYYESLLKEVEQRKKRNNDERGNVRDDR
jgi:hypothetical protein